jgi:hypothetical protein
MSYLQERPGFAW